MKLQSGLWCSNVVKSNKSIKQWLNYSNSIKLKKKKLQLIYITSDPQYNI